jgi:2,4-dienoyl-CoA reductase-like NADH-dependent reductase (Old Yellow Enzyme family)
LTEVHLFSPLQIRAVTIPNRIGLSPMCMYVAQPDGRVTDWHLVHLGARAAGGAGIVFTEAVAVAPEGRLSDGDVGLWSAEQEAGLAAIAQFVSAQGSVPAIQLAHGGRKSGRPVPWAGREPLADWGPRPSSVDVPFHPGWDAPEAMTAAQLDRVVTEFADAAERAVRCGFRFVELHFAHGYLVHQFLTPLVNTRDDDHGGDLTSRTRFAVAIVEAVRARIGDGIPLAARLSVIDWAEGGLTIDDTVEIAAVLGDAGVDLIDCSSGAAVPARSSR